MLSIQPPECGHHAILQGCPAGRSVSVWTRPSPISHDRFFMSDKQAQIDAHNKATEAFIELANRMANEQGQDIKMISAALMAASGVYATFMAAGNQGFLAPNGVERVAELYKKNLTYIQDRKKQELEEKGLEAKPVAQAEAEAKQSSGPDNTQ